MSCAAPRCAACCVLRVPPPALSSGAVFPCVGGDPALARAHTRADHAGTEKLVEKYKENPTLVNGGIAAVAVAGASVFLLTEVEAILQVCPPPAPQMHGHTQSPV